ncbi:MAG: SDR family oxidoreductase [Bacteroidales bacterium]|nr:SDR family oxidoreductase [Bacteroidales bacterium]
MKTTLVTGGAGFIGSHLCRCLLHKGHRVICMDDFSTGSRNNVSRLMADDNFSLIEHNVEMPYSIDCNEIYNLACPASPIHYQHDAVRTIKTSVMGAMNMLDLARRNKARILQSSTSEVYGNPSVSPQPESYWGNVNCNGPRSCYDESKRLVESLFVNYNLQYGVETKIVRIFNTYGPYMQPNDGRVVSNFIIQALRNQPITVYGNGFQTRSFMYVDDLVEGLLRLMASDPSLMRPVNIGNPKEITVGELANLIISLTGSRSSIEYRPLPVDDPLRRNPDISLAKEKLCWSPKVDISEGLAKTIEYFDCLLTNNKITYNAHS